MFTSTCTTTINTKYTPFPLKRRAGTGTAAAVQKKNTCLTLYLNFFPSVFFFEQIFNMQFSGVSNISSTTQIMFK